MFYQSPWYIHVSPDKCVLGDQFQKID